MRFPADDLQRAQGPRPDPYFVCAGRHAKRTNCTRPAILVDKLEHDDIKALRALAAEADLRP